MNYDSFLDSTSSPLRVLASHSLTSLHCALEKYMSFFFFFWAERGLGPELKTWVYSVTFLMLSHPFSIQLN